MNKPQTSHSLVYLRNAEEDFFSTRSFVDQSWVLSLDSSVNDEVMHIRRNMLRLINIGEFSELAEWRDPCISFVLPEVICKAPVWQCPLCHTSYDNSEIEYLLLDTVQRKAMAYTLQDLQCKKCLQVTQRFLHLSWCLCVDFG
uniref:DNA polymerase epsilon catalytic subunit n=1 Tax=Timema monikensis TaxID=170555 RepID=A0A7R9HPU0_9NEOP|nr:unnamed protein product [Timema monikensis]